jgi:hypothetical protein
MPQKNETQVAIGADLRSEMRIAATSGDVSDDAIALDRRQGGTEDPLRLIRMHWGFGPADLGGRS